MKYTSNYKLRKRIDRLERKLYRLTDPIKVKTTYTEIADLEQQLVIRIK